MNDLYVMAGLPGSGKSTIAQKVKNTLRDTIIVSRDNVRFSMINKDTNIYKIANAKAYIKLNENTIDCTEQYLICYDWKKRDTKEKGNYIGYFNITFNGNIVSEINTYPIGELIMPIREELNIIVL